MVFKELSRAKELVMGEFRNMSHLSFGQSDS